MAYNPFESFQRGFKPHQPTASQENPGGGNMDVFSAMSPIDPKTIERQQAALANPVPISLPPHLYVPEGAESLDLRKLVSITTGSTDVELFSFTAPEGSVTKIIGYGVFCDALLASTVEFKPQVNGSRVFRWHGDPSNSYKISLGLAPDLANSSMIPCQLTLAPGQVFRWLITNTSGLTTVMGARLVGYLDYTNRKTVQFG